MNEWITNNYEELKLICKKISKIDDVDDLLHCCIEQFITNKKINDVPEEHRLFFFAKIVRNNYNSTSSKYYNQYNKFKYNEFRDIDIPDKEYGEEINLKWVMNQLKLLKKDDWYYSRLFELYLEEDCSITRLSKRTSIPINSVSRDINKIRKKLINLRNKTLL